MRIVVKPVKTGVANVIQFEITEEQRSREKALKFYRELSRREKKGLTTELDLDLDLHRRHRTLGQNNLLRGLERVIAFEFDEFREDEIEPVHEALVDNYSPVITWVDPFTRAEKRRRKRTSELSTVEMSKVIGGAFHELLTVPGLKSGEDVQHYWIEWNNWRGKQALDPFGQVYQKLEEYRQQVCYCEACLSGIKATDEYGKEIITGHMAHIVSAGAGGSDDLWNRLMLCNECHSQVQHLKGWASLLKRFPHLVWRVADARVQSGGKAISEVFDDPEWKTVVKEIERRKEVA